MEWHTDLKNWHGPINRIKAESVWDPKTQTAVLMTAEYRDCGCIIMTET